MPFLLLLSDPSQIRKAIIKKSTNNKYWRGYGEQETLLYCWWECRLIYALWGTAYGSSLKKLKIEPPNGASTHYWAYAQRKIVVQKDTCTPMFCAALFTVMVGLPHCKLPQWKQHKCSSIEEWIKKMRFTYTMDITHLWKRSEIGSSVEKWMV